MTSSAVFASLMTLFISLSSVYVAAGTCAKLNCDCDRIPNAPLKMGCNTHERALRESCPDGTKDVRAYCAIHGPEAFPVAISLDTAEQPPSLDVDSSNRKIASLYWSVRQDANFSKAAFDKGDYSEATAIITIASRNIASLFKAQLSVVQAWKVENRDKQEQGAWKDYSPDTYDLAKHWLAYENKIGSELENSRQVYLNQRDDDKALVKYEALLGLYENVSRLTGELFEQTGFAYGRADRPQSAANAWKQAAELSAELMVVLSQTNINDDKVDELKNITASRLHRATYYWLLDNDGKDDEARALEAIEFASSKLLQEILTATDGE